MQKRLMYAGYGFMVISALLNYMADVVQPYLRGSRASGSETKLYYGLHTGFNFGQLLFGLMAILLLYSESDLPGRRSFQLLTLFAIAGWLAISFAYTNFAPPKINLVIVLALLGAAAFFGK